jgi:predicted amidohydrolase YtcJ
MRVDVILENGRIRTLDPDRPAATRIGVLAGRVVGLDDDLDGVTARRRIDLGGAPVLPGFHDAHFHASFTGARLAALDLRPDVVATLDALYAAVRERAAGLGPDDWVMAAGYDQNILGAHPTADALDAAAGGRPVLIEHVSAHMQVANTAAFERAGFPGREGVPDVDGGHVARDADGRAGGLLQENAMRLMHAVTRPLPVEEILRNLRLASDSAVAMGLTSLTEPGLAAPDGLGNSPVDLHAYQLAVEQGVLRPRMTVMPYVTALHDLAGFAEPDAWFGVDLGIRSGFGDDRLRLGPVKILSDGSLIGRSAAMHDCYAGEPDNTGMMVFAPDVLHRMVVGAHRAGWTVAAHAIGDAAVDAVLDAVEAAHAALPRPGVRHRIEHFALAGDAQVARAARLGVIPVPQGRFISDFGDGMLAAVGPERGEHLYRMRSLLDAGIVLPGSTDSPVSNGSPLRSIADMVNRRTASGAVLGPRERLTAEQAVRAYTHGSAYAVGQERDKGTLREGQLADLVVLSDDLLAVDPARLGEVTVGATVVGGEPVFDDGALRG